jgi:hypothetical protein
MKMKYQYIWDIRNDRLFQKRKSGGRDLYDRGISYANLAKKYWIGRLEELREKKKMKIAGAPTKAPAFVT